MRNHTIVGLWCVLAFSYVGRATEPGCQGMAYESRNQTDYGPLQVSAVRGTTRDARGGPVPNVCVGVFSEIEHKLVAFTQSDEAGHFSLKGVPAGEYRLVTRYEGFCPANAKLRLDRRASGKWRLFVQLRFAGLDTCSYVELK